MIVKKANLALSLYLLASAAFFFLVGLPVLHGLLDFQFYADSPTYFAAAEQMDLSWSLIQISSNYFGPVLVVKLMRSSYTGIYLFNALLFVVSWRLVVRHLDVRPMRYFVLLAASPLVFTSLMSVNKEIVGVLVVSLFAVYLARAGKGYLALALVLSMLVRWQMTLVLLFSWCVLRTPYPLRRHRFATLVVALLAISAIYRANLSTFEEVNSVAVLGEAQTTEGSGLYSRFLGIQNAGGYFLVVIPKTLHQYVGLLAGRYRSFLDFRNKAELYNNNFVYLQSAVNLLLLGLVVWARRFRLSDDLIFFACAYCMVFALSPIYSPRYFTPVSILFAMVLAQPRPASRAEPEAETARVLGPA